MQKDFRSVEELLVRFKFLGATRVFCKRLSENDNSKQQIYLGGSFEVLSFFPIKEVQSFPSLQYPNLKASMHFSWVTPHAIAQAPKAQLILYPQYPEVRLSGFLLGCPIAPSAHMQPVSKEKRRRQDSRVLVFGTTPDEKILAALAPSGSSLSKELVQKIGRASGVFFDLTLPPDSDQNRNELLSALRVIHAHGFHASCRLDKLGNRIPYLARNGGGYTLEALLGISPNGNAAPDYLGWEVKAYGDSRITLMTPEPNGGYYGEKGVQAFVARYGRDRPDGSRYFTGTHKAMALCTTSGMTMRLRGYNKEKQVIEEVDGAIELIDAHGKLAASWSYATLLPHWTTKHTYAAYVPYEKRIAPIAYKYNSPIVLGEQTDFGLLLSAISDHAVIYDPGCKTTVENGRTKVKARSQFRVNVKNLKLLYKTLRTEAL